MSVVENEGSDGIGVVAQGVVIVSVFALVLVGMLALAWRDAAVAELAVATPTPGQSDAPATSASPGAATPVPAVDAGGPGTYTVQPGDSLFSVASALGIGPNELIAWNQETYPTLPSTPALTAGWVLRTDGPSLATPTPDRTPEPTAPPPQTAGGVTLPVFGASAFPASGSVTVGYYPVIGGSAREIARSMETNGPHSGWIGGRATAAVEVSASFGFEFVEGGGGCRVETFDSTPVEASYHVILPSWQPPADTPSSVVEWWVANITETVDHEGHHIELYESFLPDMNAAVLNGTCESAEADLVRLWNEASRANCIFDLEEYGYAAGLTVEACLAE